MQFDLDVAHALHEQMTAWQQLVPVSVRWKRDAVVAAVRLEARKACFLLALHTFKECFEGLVQTAKNLLSTVTIRQAKVTRCSNFGQLGGLVVVVDALALRCVCFDALLQCRIIEAAGFRQLYTQALGFLVGYSLYLNVLRINDLSGSRCTSSPLLPKRGRLFQRSRNDTTK